jgi:putative hydrolase of the HAD superfamily
MTTKQAFDLVGFDGDDTLWHNERFYRMGRERFQALLAQSGVSLSAEDVDDRVNETELRNIRYYGYGVSSFTLSLIEAAIDLTGGRIPAQDIRELLALSRDMLTAEVELFVGARDAVVSLAGRFPLVLITKGDLLHQRAKADQSGLGPFFRHVEVVSHKVEDTYSAILARYGVDPSRFLMIGNSLRSDILPVIRIGGWAIHIPAELSWAHEDGEVPTDGRERFSQIDRIDRLPEAVSALVQGRLSPPGHPAGR